MEKLIYRIVNMISLNFNRDQIVKQLSDEFSNEDIFLAYQAAKILYGDFIK